MRTKFLFIIIVFFTSSILLAQQNKIDSLEQVIKSSTEGITVFKAYYKLGDLFWYSNPDTAMKYFIISRNLNETYLKNNPLTSNKVDIEKFFASTINDIGLILYNKGETKKAQIHYQESIDIRVRINDKKGLAETYSNFGRLTYNNGDIKKALKYYNKCLKIREEINDKKGISIIYNNLGAIYYNQDDIENALEYYKKSIELRIEIGATNSIAPTLSNIGVAYYNKAELALKTNTKNISDSLINLSYKYYKRSLKIRKQINDKRGIAIVYKNIGNIFFLKLKIDSARMFYHKAIEIQKEIGDNIILVSSLVKLGILNKYENNIPALKRNAEKAYKISMKIENPKLIAMSSSLMKDLSIINGDYKGAYKYYNQQIKMLDSLQNKQNYIVTQKQQAKYEYQKQATIDSLAHIKEIEIKNFDIARIKKEKEIKSTQQNYLIIGLILMFIIAFVIFGNYKAKKKANSLIQEKNYKLHSQNEEISLQHDLVTEQKYEIEKIHNKISQSIDYAKFIQESLLPNINIIKKNFSDFSLIYLPKDVVSGDFYWWHKTNDTSIITAADCTGHGVPGAFMSVLGISLLREIVIKGKTTNTAKILDELRSEIIKVLNQTDEIGSQKDGMDMSIISINHKNNMLQYSGANNPIYIVSDSNLELTNEPNDNIKSFEDTQITNNNSKKIFEIKPDKMPVSIYSRIKNFTTNKIQLQKGDTVYLFSDGYIDQFGGNNAKKFKSKPFKKLLLSINNEPLNTQKDILINEFHKWKLNTEQIDDVLIILTKI